MTTAALKPPPVPLNAAVNKRKRLSYRRARLGICVADRMEIPRDFRVLLSAFGRLDEAFVDADQRDKDVKREITAATEKFLKDFVLRWKWDIARHPELYRIFFVPRTNI